MISSAEQESLLAALERDGFVAVRGFLDAGALEDLESHLVRFLAETVPRMPDHHVFYEDKADPATLKQLQHLHRYDEHFERLFTTGPLRTLAERLLRGQVVPRNLQYFNKPAQRAMPTPPHQDGFYFMLDPCEALTMWLALDRVDEETGCVRYVQGSHRRGIRRHGRTQTLGFSQGIIDYPGPEDLAQECAMPADPGDLLVHDARTIHRADTNRSRDRSRRALGFIYFSVRAREDRAAQEAYQRRLAKELKNAGRI